MAFTIRISNIYIQTFFFVIALNVATESIFAVQHRIQQIVIHPNYASTANSIVNDLALLVTIARIEWSRGVGPICLPLLQSFVETFASLIFHLVTNSPQFQL